MSQLTAHGGVHASGTHAGHTYRELSGDNIAPPASTKGLSGFFLVLGLAGLGATVAGGMAAGRPLHAIALEGASRSFAPSTVGSSVRSSPAAFWGGE